MTSQFTPGPEMHRPTVVTDGGPWALHDVACPVCSEHSAILNLNLGVFEPCGACAAAGWQLRRRRRWWRRR